MAFYSHPPIQLYAYAPMAIPNQPEFYAVYPSGGHPGMVDASAFYYDPKGVVGQSTGESRIFKPSLSSVSCKLWCTGPGSDFIEFPFSFTLPPLSSPLPNKFVT